MVLDHVGIVVKSIEDSLGHWESVFGYRPMTQVVTNTRQRVHVMFLEREGSLPVKLVQPVDSSSSVHALAQRGGGLHHLCFRCESVDAEVARLAAIGVRVIAPAQPGEAFGDHPIAFLYAGGGMTFELIDTLTRAGRLSEA